MDEPGRVPIFWLTAQTRDGWQRSAQVAPEGQVWASGTCFVEAGLADVVLATSSELRTMGGELPPAVNVSSAHCPDKAAGCAVSVVADDGEA